ncbi:DUF4412 domain-containing protein [Pedobacter sp. SL55]|uniref:DUF4412 domain-containing protein n=1 Tax=Pedobacter sp. SL55 TaxID=2995161 RepID=UPI00226E18DB|nr:DUF4412 domain-containing protein [Pedobacter sp. SL55]WAC40258.1 DUF4412 domain-containing protein [Pedobacter sp. SL55]
MMFKSVKTGFLATILVATAVMANAQKKISQGTVTYGVEYSLPAEQASMASQLPKEQKVKFSGNVMRMDMQQGPASIGILQDFVQKTGLMLIDVPIAQMQYAVKMSKEEIEQAEASAPKLIDFKATGEKQKVGDYNAEKYSYKDDKGGTYELWATNDIELPNGFAGSQFKDIKGSLVKYTTFQNGMKVTLTVKSISEDKVGPFSLEVPSGYELKTMQEIMAMQGGGE